jgi:glycosyltransferase involved in cell wall biosynthesis
MKIVYFIDSLRQGGGSQKFLVSLASGLAARGHNQTVICLNDNPDPSFVKQLKHSAIPVRVIGKIQLVAGFGILNTIWWLKKERFDTAVTLLFYSDVFGRFMTHVAGIPQIISSLRARNIHYNRMQRYLVRHTVRWVHKVVLCSEHIRDFAEAEEGVLPDQVEVIPNGIDPKQFDILVDSGDIRGELGIPKDALLLGSIGRLEYQKGYDILLNALAILNREDIHLALIGTGSKEKVLRYQAQRLGLSLRTHFLGYREDVIPLLKSFDLYVQPSRFEGMPNALMEAMAAGCPVIATAIDGIPELIYDEIHGWLISKAEPRELTHVLSKVLNNPLDSRERACASKNLISRKYNLVNIIIEWEKLLIGD